MAPLVSEPGKLRSVFAFDNGYLAAPFLTNYPIWVFDENGDLEEQYFETRTIKMLDPLAGYIKTKDDPSMYYSGKYGVDIEYLGIYSNNHLLTQKRTTTYADNGATMGRDTINFFYGNIKHLNPTRISRLNSKGDSIINYFKYPLDYPNPLNSSNAGYLIQKNVLNNFLETYQTIKKSDGEYYSAGTNLNFGLTTSGKLYLGTSMELRLKSPKKLGSNISLDLWSKFAVKGINPNGNIVEYELNQTKPFSLIWGYNGKKIIAEVENALSKDVAFANFESTDRGNWTYGGIPNSTGGAITGVNSYPLTQGVISKSGISTNETYELHYWYKKGGTVSVTGGSISLEQVLVEKHGWILAKRLIKGAGAITISGNGIIDDLRINPINAKMKTYTYNPIEGMSSMTDEKGIITYFTYDGAGRLRDILDINKVIRERTGYNLGLSSN